MSIIGLKLLCSSLEFDYEQLAIVLVALDCETLPRARPVHWHSFLKHSRLFFQIFFVITENTNMQTANKLMQI